MEKVPMSGKKSKTKGATPSSTGNSKQQRGGKPGDPSSSTNDEQMTTRNPSLAIGQAKPPSHSCMNMDKNMGGKRR
ncbi:unnamed protein product [Absidia cylindrospora]